MATFQIPWYATGFRGDELEQGLNEIAAIAMRYGATAYEVMRSLDDRYRFVQVVDFPEKVGFQKYWSGPEMTEFRVRHSSHYQVPVVYGAWERTTAGRLTEVDELPLPAGNGGSAVA